MVITFFSRIETNPEEDDRDGDSPAATTFERPYGWNGFDPCIQEFNHFF